MVRLARLFLCHDDMLSRGTSEHPGGGGVELSCVRIHWSNNSARLRRDEAPRLLSMGAIH